MPSLDLFAQGSFFFYGGEKNLVVRTGKERMGGICR